MGENTGIQWCHHTFNGWWGCTKVSRACDACYAEEWAARTGNPSLWGPKADRRIASPSYWRGPLKWNAAAAAAGERRRVFCASMSDVFEDRPDLEEPRQRLWKLIEETPALDWMLLTKRPENHDMVPLAWQTGSRRPKNVWLGATVENNDPRVLQRIDDVIRAPWPAVRFLSMEPLIDRVVLPDEALSGDVIRVPVTPEGFGPAFDMKLDLVIVGGESGRKPRPFQLDNARALRDQCREHGTAFFFKQAGAVPMDGELLIQLRDRRHGGDITEIPDDLQIRMMPGDRWAA